MGCWPLATSYFELLARVTGVGDHWFSPLVEAMLFISGKPSVEQASIRMVSSVVLVHWCNDVLVLPYLWSMDVIGHKYESAYHLY